MSIRKGTGWLDTAEDIALGWPTATLRHIMRANPYQGTGVRDTDWLILVAHVSSQRAEDPMATAERLSLYVTSYREAHKALLMPTIVKENQSHG